MKFAIKTFIITAIACMTAWGGAPVSGFAETSADAVSIAPYTVSREAPELSGKLSLAGSTVLGNLGARWTEQFGALHPKVKTGFADQGFLTGMPSLTAGRVSAVLLGRAPRQEEVAEFEKQFGYRPAAFRVAVDVPAVFVHKDNPLKGLTREQVTVLFNSLRRDASEKITRWGQLGLTGEWADRPIRVYTRKAGSGTAGLAEVVRSVGADAEGIAMSGVAFAAVGARVLPIAETADGAFIEPAAGNEDYPLTRFLHLCINKVPGESIDPLAREFIRYVLSREGQQAVGEYGYFSLPPALLAVETGRLNGADAVLLAEGKDMP